MAKFREWHYFKVYDKDWDIAGPIIERFYQTNKQIDKELNYTLQSQPHDCTLLVGLTCCALDMDELKAKLRSAGLKVW